MSNRFKFRVWDKINDKWMSHQLLDIEKGLLTGFYNDEEAFKRRYIIMQSTGLKDKNGKLIYEKDIVRFKDCNDILVINYQKGMACFAPQFYYKGKYGGRLWFDDYDNFEHQFYQSDNFTVIGNIYENKELLDERN